MQYHPHPPPNPGINYSHDDSSGQGNYSPLENEARDREYENLQQQYMENKKDSNPFSQDYNRRDKDEKPKDSIERNIEEEEKIKKYESKDSKEKEEISKKQIELEINQEITKVGFENSKKAKTIEDAINLAIKQEQSILVSK